MTLTVLQIDRSALAEVKVIRQNYCGAVYVPWALKAAFHDTDIDIDILARILVDSPDTPTSLRGSSLEVSRGYRCRYRGMRP